MPTQTPVGEQPIRERSTTEEWPIIERLLTLGESLADEEVGEEEVSEEVSEEVEVIEEAEVVEKAEVSEKKLAWYTAVWNFAAKWGGYLWEKLLGTLGITKEEGDVFKELDVNYSAVAYEQGKEYADAISAVSITVLPSVRSSAAYQKALEAVSNPTIFMDTHRHLSRFGSNLDWERVDDRAPYLFRGTRGVPRTLEAAKGVWEKIPRATRGAGPEATARYLNPRDWSHIYPHNWGGSNDPRNGFFEDRSINRARGAAIVTQSEITAAQIASQSEAFQVTLQQAAKNALKTGVASGLVLATVAVLEYGLQYQKGEITLKEMQLEIAKVTGISVGIGAGISGLVTAMALSFPAIIPVVTVISVPLAIVGFSLLTPRLIEAGKGWYEVFLEKSPLKPAALRYWFARRYEDVRFFLLRRNAEEYQTLYCRPSPIIIDWPSPGIEYLPGYYSWVLHDTYCN